MQHSYVTLRMGRIVGRMGPRICRIRLGVPAQIEYLNDPIPHSLAVKNLFYRNALAMRGWHAMQLVDHVYEFFDGRQDAASTRSPTLQNPGVTPAAMAGVQRSVPWRLTKL